MMHGTLSRALNIFEPVLVGSLLRLASRDSGGRNLLHLFPVRKGQNKEQVPQHLQECWLELATWRYAKGQKRVSRSTAAHSKRRPGASARKAAWLVKLNPKPYSLNPSP